MDEINKEWRKIALSFCFIIINLFVGIAGYMILEQYTVTDAVYMAMITLSTVGYTEPHPLHDSGKIFTILYITINLGLFAYFLSIVSNYLIEGKLRRAFRNYKINMELHELKKHIIVCGYGRTGARACDELKANDLPFMVIEQKRELLINEDDKDINFPFIIGNAVDDEILKKAEIKKATHILITLPDDADNVFISLTAREMNENIIIISRASEDSTVSKLKRAGANKVIMPDAIGGLHMANLITKPEVIDFLEIINNLEENYTLDEILYKQLKPEFRDKSLEKLSIHANSGALILGLKNNEKNFQINPDLSTQFSKDDVLIVFGKTDELKKLRSFYCAEYKSGKNIL